VVLSCVSEGNPTPTYKWLSPNGTEVSSTNQLVFSSMMVDQSGTYTCVTQNTYNSKTSNAASTVIIKIGEFKETVMCILNMYNRNITP